VARTAADVVHALSLSDAELTAIGRRAMERTLAEHTVDHRARELVEKLTTSLAPDVRGTHWPDTIQTGV